jgi:cytochrome c oxidase assembly protein subunit 15
VIWFTLEKVKAENNLGMHRKISGGLVAALALQALIGVVQSRLGVPPLLVGLHMVGASVLASLLTFQWLSLRAK